MEDSLDIHAAQRNATSKCISARCKVVSQMTSVPVATLIEFMWRSPEVQPRYGVDGGFKRTGVPFNPSTVPHVEVLFKTVQDLAEADTTVKEVVEARSEFQHGIYHAPMDASKIVEELRKRQGRSASYKEVKPPTTRSKELGKMAGEILHELDGLTPTVRRSLNGPLQVVVAAVDRRNAARVALEGGQQETLSQVKADVVSNVKKCLLWDDPAGAVKGYADTIKQETAKLKSEWKSLRGEAKMVKATIATPESPESPER